LLRCSRYKTIVNTENDQTGDEESGESQDAYENIFDEDEELFDLSFQELAEVLPGGEDEAHAYVTRMAQRTLDLLYKVREDDPDADVDGRNINELIAELEDYIARVEESELELKAVAQKHIDCYAEMCLHKASFPSPFWSYAATVGRYFYPAHPSVQTYFDIEDLREYLKRLEPDPVHLLN